MCLSTSSSESSGTSSNPSMRAGARLEEAQQLERARRAVDAGPGDRARRDRRHQPQRDGGDHAERPFRADQQLVEAVAAIVLLEAGQAAVDEPSGSTASTPATSARIVPNFSTCVPPALVEVEAADGAAAARAERQRKAHADLVGARRAASRGSRPLRRPRGGCRRRSSGCGSSAAATAAAPSRRPAESRRRPCRCCRPAGPAARDARRRGWTIAATSRSRPARASPATRHARGRASR